MVEEYEGDVVGRAKPNKTGLQNYVTLKQVKIRIEKWFNRKSNPIDIPVVIFNNKIKVCNALCTLQICNGMNAVHRYQSSPNEARIFCSSQSRSMIITKSNYSTD